MTEVADNLGGGVTDTYERSAEYLDLLIAETWQSLAPALTEVLHTAHAKDGPVADLGAGTGRGIEVTCAALPGVDPILAVEPSTIVRAVLLPRVHGALARLGRAGGLRAQKAQPAGIRTRPLGALWSCVAHPPSPASPAGV